MEQLASGVVLGGAGSLLLGLFLDLVAGTGTRAGPDSPANHGARRARDRATDDRAGNSATGAANSGPGLVVTLGRLAGDRAASSTDAHTDSAPEGPPTRTDRRAAERTSAGAHGLGPDSSSRGPCSSASLSSRGPDRSTHGVPFHFKIAAGFPPSALPRRWGWRPAASIRRSLRRYESDPATARAAGVLGPPRAPNRRAWPSARPPSAPPRTYSGKQRTRVHIRSNRGARRCRSQTTRRGGSARWMPSRCFKARTRQGQVDPCRARADDRARREKTRTELFAKLKRELTVHEIIEEEIFYPTLKQAPQARDIVLEGYEEHHVVDTVMGERDDPARGDETWGPKCKVMIENIEHHIEEEEGDSSSRPASVFDRAELEQLGAAMEARKEEAMREH